MTLFQRSDQGLAEVKQQDRDAKTRLQISSVPYFVIEQKYALSGAQASALTILGLLLHIRKFIGVVNMISKRLNQDHRMRGLGSGQVEQPKL
jgi:hypothetical protein